MKNIIVILVIAMALVSCSDAPPAQGNTQSVSTATKDGRPSKVYKITGQTMGTTYNITSDLSNLSQIKMNIDQLLIEINHEVSTYEEDSFISMFNKSNENVVLQNTRNYENEFRHFKKNYNVAREVYDKSRGAFDPTVLPLVNYWGFGTNKKNPDQIDKAKLEAIRADVGFVKIDKLMVSEKRKQYLVKERPGIQLDFSALAKGYAVDQVALLLEKGGSNNYLVEIGGEVRVKGTSEKADFWVLGINKPELDSDVNSVFRKMQLTDIAMASSGNYRNYFKLGDKIYSHTINPKTGYPERNELLSATVLAKECIIADAYATACMVLGVEEARILIDQVEGVEAYLIYSNEKGELSELQTNGASYYLVD